MKTKISSKLRLTALLLSLTFLYELIFPTVAWALTGGPSQPEVQSFEPVGTTVQKTVILTPLRRFILTP